VIVVDLNLLLYATNQNAIQHARARQWWERCLSEGTPVGLAWAVIVGFVRLTTNPRVMPHPISAADAIGVVDQWLSEPAVEIIEPTERHWDILKELLAALGTAGNLTSDAHLAALAIERGAQLASTDNDFSRFAGLRWSNPIA
jgi:uncharacterized protein